MTHSDAEYLRAAFRQERQGVTQMSHISTVLRAHQTAGLFLPWLPTLPTKFISMTVCVDWTVFLTLTSPFNPQPLWNPVLSAVDLGVPSFIYLIKTPELCATAYDAEAAAMPWHSHPAISSSLFWAVCSFPQPSWGRNPLTRTPHQCQGSSQSWDCSLQPIQAPLPAAPLAQPVDPCCPTTVQAVY